MSVGRYPGLAQTTDLSAHSFCAINAPSRGRARRTARSIRSASRSSTASVSTSSTVSRGWSRASSGRRGTTVARAKPTGAVTRTVPEGSSPPSRTMSWARSSSSTTGSMRSKYSRPASLIDSRRVLRWKSRTPSSFSRPAMERETADDVHEDFEAAQFHPGTLRRAAHQRSIRRPP